MWGWHGSVEKMARREGLCTHPYLFCESCSHTSHIAFSVAGSSKALAVNRKAVMANKCAGSSRASLQMLFGMLDLPSPVSKKNVYTQHSVVICDQARLRRAARRKRKGLDDKRTQKEGVMYTPGAFDCDLPGPSKRARTQ